ncbi:MAG: hypothetical protein A4E26_00018 [Methanobacterium sp. PtaU1.Bin097]|nr:MAG: hypothetical protein A4E26_00018 [Methanobacterium sp. PtaU1.Bin097]
MHLVLTRKLVNQGIIFLLYLPDYMGCWLWGWGHSSQPQFKELVNLMIAGVDWLLQLVKVDYLLIKFRQIGLEQYQICRTSLAVVLAQYAAILFLWERPE